MTYGRSHKVGKANVGTGEHAHVWVEHLRDAVEQHPVPVVVDDPGTEHGRRLIRALGARVSSPPAAIIPAVQTIPAHDLASSADCKEPGCPKEAGNQGGPTRGYCDEHRKQRQHEITQKRLATAHPPNAAPARNGDAPTAGSSIEQATRQIVPVARELDRKLGRRDRARTDLQKAAADVKPVIEEFADALARLREHAEQALK